MDLYGLDRPSVRWAAAWRTISENKTVLANPELPSTWNRLQRKRNSGVQFVSLAVLEIYLWVRQVIYNFHKNKLNISLRNKMHGKIIMADMSFCQQGFVNKLQLSLIFWNFFQRKKKFLFFISDPYSLVIYEVQTISNHPCSFSGVCCTGRI